MGGIPDSIDDTDAGMMYYSTTPDSNTSDEHRDPNLHERGLVPLPRFLSAIRAVAADHDKVIIVLKWFATCLQTLAKYGKGNMPETASELQAFAIVSKKSDDSWEECQTSCPELRGITALRIRGEFDGQLDAIIDYFGDLNEDFDFNGIRVNGAQAYVLSSLIHPTVDTDGELSNLVLKSQPVYIDHPSNYEEQLLLQSNMQNTEVYERMMPDIPAMKHLLLLYSSNEKILTTLINSFGELASNLCDIFLANHNQYKDEKILVLEDEALSNHAQDVANPLSDKPLNLRLALANINLRGTIELLARDIDLMTLGMDEHERGCLRWHVLRWVLYCAIDPFEDRAGLLMIGRVVYGNIQWSKCLHGNPPDVDFNPFPDSRSDAVDSSEESEADSDTDYEYLSDIDFEPSGAEIPVKEFASSIVAEEGATCSICLDGYQPGYSLPMKLNCCPHIYHQQCLHDLINGIQKHSNACPICRAITCPRRQRRRISDQDEESEDSDDSSGEDIDESNTNTDMSDDYS
ncbi:hypothetical protein BDV96DRAFT_683991 [Lophiotrema nucula]|uniref:RING-type domain-containing protein n=1 Tax=Lophiotrema nucula TaxID=690887 RepID=A0A6A5ZLQ8_9PLEO|nr:hypothetical protein BDV96DRAFT_683991 [Lophiotrema nucula]